MFGIGAKITLSTVITVLVVAVLVRMYGSHVPGLNSINPM